MKFFFKFHVLRQSQKSSQFLFYRPNNKMNELKKKSLLKKLKGGPHPEHTATTERDRGDPVRPDIRRHRERAKPALQVPGLPRVRKVRGGPVDGELLRVKSDLGGGPPNLRAVLELQESGDRPGQRQQPSGAGGA